MRRVRTSEYSRTWQDQIVYVLIPSKFCNSDPANDVMKNRYQLPNPNYEGGFLGGDIAGIRRKMSYLKGLGITSVLLYPMFSNDAQPFGKYLAAGYRVRDYQSIDPNFGTDRDFAGMISDFHHSPRVNVILDLPIAMTGLEHPWMRDAARYPWYYRPWNAADATSNIGKAPMRLPYGSVDNDYGMPILNAVHGMRSGTETYRELRDNLLFRMADRFDVDGYRYDSAQNVDPTFWRQVIGEFRDRYRRSKPDFIQLAEVFLWPNKRPWQIWAQEFMNRRTANSVGPIGMDGVYDFGLIASIQDVFAKGRAVSLLVDQMKQQAVYYEHPEKLIASVDNYEENSFLSKVTGGNTKPKLLLALTFLLTIDRVPFLYSGNEFGIDYRRPGALFQADLDRSFHAQFKRLVHIRRANAAFRRGGMEWLDLTPTILSYRRAMKNQNFVVVLNNAARTQSLTLDLGARRIACSQVENLLAPNDSQIHLERPSSKGLTLKVTLNPWEAKIIRCR